MLLPFAFRWLVRGGAVRAVWNDACLPVVTDPCEINAPDLETLAPPGPTSRQTA